MNVYCKKCRHEECNNLFNDFVCENVCDICSGETKAWEVMLKKTLSIKDLNEEATVFVIRKRSSFVTKVITEFLSHVRLRALANDTEIPVKKRKGVKRTK